MDDADTTDDEQRDDYVPFETFDPEDHRPDNCQCWGQEDVPCWHCYLSGFETPNPDAPEWTPVD